MEPKKKKSPADEAVDAAVKGAVGGAITHAGDPYAAGLAAVGAVAGHIAAKAVAFARASIQQRRSTDALLGVGSVVELDERATEIEAKLARLIEAAGHDEGARARAIGSFEAVLEAWMRASRRAADDRKRRILMAALVSGLDEDAFREGLTLTILERLERLDYGAIRLLGQLERARDSNEAAAVMRANDLSGHFLKELRGCDLLPPSASSPSPLGLRVLRFVREELQNRMREDEDYNRS